MTADIDDLPFYLGIWLHPEVLRHGIRIEGAPATGKSVLLTLMRLTLSDWMRTHSTRRIHVVDFDSKGDLYKIGKCFPGDVPFYNLNPFVEADVFDVAGEIESPLDIAELVALLIEIGANQNQPFFPQSARNIAEDFALLFWKVARGNFTLRDLVLACTSIDNMRDVADSSPITRHLNALLSTNEVGMSIAATLMTEMRKYRAIAALYESRERQGGNSVRKVTTQSIRKDPCSVTLLPYHHKAINTLGPLVKLFLLRFQQNTLADNARDVLAPIILDELALLSGSGGLTGGVDLSLTAIMGREAGLAAVVAYQSYLMASNALGKGRLDSLLSTMKTYVVFHLPHIEDATQAAKQLSSMRALVRTDSASSTSPDFAGALKGGTSSTSTSWSQSYQMVENVTAHDIQSLNVPARGNRDMEFFLVTVGTRYQPVKVKVNLDEVLDYIKSRAVPMAPPPPRSSEDMVIREWDDADRERLRIYARQGQDNGGSDRRKKKGRRGP